IGAAAVPDEDVKAPYDGLVEPAEEAAPALEAVEAPIRQSLADQTTQDAVFSRIDELQDTPEVEIKIYSSRPLNIERYAVLIKPVFLNSKRGFLLLPHLRARTLWHFLSVYR